jgi:hypothetical protein
MNNKFKILSIVCVVAVAIAAVWNLAQSHNEVALSDLVLENVKALARESDEGTLYGTLSEPYRFCCAPGSNDCGAAACPFEVGGE